MVNGFLKLLQPLFVFDTEALLFVHDHQPEIAKNHVLGQKSMRADGYIDLAFRQVRQRGLDFLGRAESAEHLDADREWLEAPAEGLEMLKCEDCSRSQDGHLLSV